LWNVVVHYDSWWMLVTCTLILIMNTWKITGQGSPYKLWLFEILSMWHRHTKKLSNASLLTFRSVNGNKIKDWIVQSSYSGQDFDPHKIMTRVQVTKSLCHLGTIPEVIPRFEDISAPITPMLAAISESIPSRRHPRLRHEDSPKSAATRSLTIRQYDPRDLRIWLRRQILAPSSHSTSMRGPRTLSFSDIRNYQISPRSPWHSEISMI